MQTIRSWFSSVSISRKLFWEVILFPFLVTRSSWLLVAYFVSGNYLPNPTYERFFNRGFFLTRIFPVDIFARWDSAAYLSILKNGYIPSRDITTVFSNIPFFPLYSYLVKSIGWLGIHLPDGFYVTFGVILSNIFFLASAILLYKLILIELNFSEQTARRTLGLLFVFPTSFIFSSFYNESLFLLLALLCFTFALKDKWLMAAFCAGLILVTRVQGIIVWGSLILLYMERKNWNFSKIENDVIWLLVSPVALILHLINLYQITGFILAPYAAQAAWKKSESGILSNIAVNLNSPNLDVFKIDLILVIIFIVAGIYLFNKWQIKSYGFLALSLCLIPIVSGSLVSISRYLLAVFPVFILFGEKLKRTEVYEATRALLFTLQIIYFAGWINYYWIA